MTTSLSRLAAISPVRALCGLAAAVAALASPAVHAADYPSKPIKIIVAYPAGQGTDIATRYLAEQIPADLERARAFARKNR